MQPSIAITRAEFAERRVRLAEHLQAQGLAAALLFDNYYVLYYSGFAFVPTERPIAFVLSAHGEAALFVPRLELEHAHNDSGFERVYHYVEYPYE
ncbi:MAG TPA: aminopeptidase P family N-terminal domain-containing protein, partial [Chloroflexota bacterium]|nr:aminopeptidase P family N-terminal domain-containing protein [Chloroflexota bacterium]